MAGAELIVHDVAELAGDGDGIVGGVRANGHLLVIGGPPTRVFDVAPDGTKTVVAGCGCSDTGQGFGDGGPATDAVVDSPADVEPTSDGGFLISQFSTFPFGEGLQGALVRKVDADGTITTVAGNGDRDASGDGGPATEAGLGQGYLYLSETADGGFLISGTVGHTTATHSVRLVDADGNISTVAGTGAPGFAGDGGPATEAQLNQPAEVDAIDDGGFLIQDSANCRIRAVDGAGDIDTLAGNGEMHEVGEPPDVHEQCVVHGRELADGVSALDEPLTFADVATLPGGGFLTFMGGYTRLLQIDSSSIVTTVMGLGLGGWGGDGCPASDVALQGPTSLAYSDGTYYYADSSSLHDGRLWSVLRSVSEGTVTGCEIIGISGTPKDDEIDGGDYHEKVLAGNGEDVIDGGGGGDKLLGQDGGDAIDAGPGPDSVSGGSGGDHIDVSGGGTDSVNCGSGRDVVNESGSDRVASNCEVVR
jgi:hypothetical protein